MNTDINKKQTYENLLNWFNSLPENKKILYKDFLRNYYKATNIFFPNFQMKQVLEFNNLTLQKNLCKKEISYDYKELNMITLLAKYFFKVKSIPVLQQELKENGSVFTCDISKIINNTSAQKVFQDGKIYIKYTKNKNNNWFLEVSNSSPKKSHNWKCYHYAEKKKSIISINSYSTDYEKINEENETGIVLTNFFRTFLDKKDTCVLVLRNNQARIKTLCEILNIKDIVNNKNYTKQ